MRVLVTFMVVIGILIVAGFAFVGYEVYQRANDPERTVLGGATPVTSVDSPDAGFALGPDARITDVFDSGGRVVVHLTEGEAGDRLLILDPRTGRTVLDLRAGDSGRAADHDAAGEARPAE